MSKTNNKINANKETADALAAKNVVAVSVHAEPGANWDRVITPTKGAKDETGVFDFERSLDGVSVKVTGVRYAKIDDRGRVMQVRIVLNNKASEHPWWTVKDAIDAHAIDESFAKYTGHFTECDAKIARVEIMEQIGLPVSDGICNAYANAVQAKKDAIKAKRQKEMEIVNAGRDKYVNDAKIHADKRFTKIAERVSKLVGKEV